MTPQEFFKNDAFATAAGIEIVSAKPGYAQARLTVGAQHLNAGGRTQGGALFTLADLAIAVAANMHGSMAFSTTSNISFFRGSGVGETLVAEAKELYLHPRMANYQCDITNEKGELVAQMTAQLYRKDVPVPL
ncbi:MAG: PaaI family thioesterase [Bacteroidaceae bacterium]|jgi:acyl-CoA thioesterase